MLRIIKAEIKHNNYVLDIGCNTGVLLDFAHNYTKHTYGVEYSEMARKITARKGHKTYEYSIQIPENVKFDIIFAFDLIEHLYMVSSFSHIL